MKKLKGQRGFTLVEMLIVVAIIAILVAVSIPMVNASLERARQATDAANERAAKMEIITRYLTNTEYAPGKKVVASEGKEPIGSIPGSVVRECYAYDAASGKLTQKVPTPYGKCTAHKRNHKGRFLLLWIHEDGEVEMMWTSGFPAPGQLTDGMSKGAYLCSNEMNG